MKIAYFSPISPAQTGIGDYSEDVLPYLTSFSEIDIFIDDYQPSERMAKNYNIYHYMAFEAKDMEKNYDLCLYHMGNNPFHAYIYDALLKRPGLVVLHDYLLHHLMAYITWGRGKPALYVQEMEYAHGQMGKIMATLRLEGKFDEALNFLFPMNKRVVEKSLGIIVHSDFAKKQLLEAFPSARVKKINMGIPLPEQWPLERKEEVRKKLKIPLDLFLMGSFGFVTPIKRIDAGLRAFAHFKAYEPKSLFLIVGEFSPACDFTDLIHQLKLQDSVKITGYVPHELYQQYLNICDVLINLRFPSAGETPASILKAMALAKPVITSKYQQLDELPDDCCAKVDVGELEEEMLLEYLKVLSNQPTLREKMGKNAREYVAQHHRLEDTVKAYLEFMEAILKETPPSAHKPSIVRPQPLLDEVAQALCEMGVEEDWDFILKEVASAICSLHID